VLLREVVGTEGRGEGGQRGALLVADDGGNGCPSIKSRDANQNPAFD
jgi:hypothetical protein